MATIHTFTGNEVIATEVPKYLNDNFSAINDEVVDLSKTTIKTINGEQPTDNDFKITGFDSYWESGEAVEVGDIRVPKGREHTGLFLECVQAGTTGETQPTLDTAVLANYSHTGRIGQVRWIYNIAEKDDDEIFATGVRYSRETYSALWAYVQTKPALLITESEWQAKYQETGGKFVPYFSEGDGSTDFRTPLLAAYATGVTDNSKIGTFKADSSASVADLISNHYHGFGYNSGNNAGSFLATSATQSFPLKPTSGYRGWNGSGGGGGYSGDTTSYAGNMITSMPLSASGGSSSGTTTLNPDTMYGVWVIKAFGVIVNSDNTELSNVLVNIENNNEKISDFETKYDFVVESWIDGTSWYRKYKSGWVEQGGESNAGSTVTLFVPFTHNEYAVRITSIAYTGTAAGGADVWGVYDRTTLTMRLGKYNGQYNGIVFNWYACGQGA